MSSTDDENKAGSMPKREVIINNLCYLTRALVKNNIVKQSPYLILLVIEYLMMLYYTMRLADVKSFLNVFSAIESFLDVGTNELGQVITASDQSTFTTQAHQKAEIHIYIMCIFSGIYMAFTITFITYIFKVNSYDKTKESSYALKTISLIMTLSGTVLQTPVIISIFICIKIMIIKLASKLVIINVLALLLLIINFTAGNFYFLRFYNMEVPNEEIPWSFNQTGGIYFKVLLKIILCSQELYREQLSQKGVSITMGLVVVTLLIIILAYRMNTPNIFNASVHDATLMLEGVFVSLGLIGLIALLSDRDIFSTLAYTFVFIPVMVKIILAIDQQRKHQVLYKMKNDTELSQNEWLIAVTHLLKMTKRQSESDLAQLMSFTYQHKLLCYSTNCICQFFTQYCQDPEKFRKKKKRIYRGYKDDGVKFVQVKAEGELAGIMKEVLDNQLNSTLQTHEEGGQLSYASNLQGAESTLNAFIPSEIYTREGDTIARLGEDNDGMSQMINFNTINSNMLESTYVRADSKNQPQPNEDLFREPMMMEFFSKGNILKGTAYDGFDTNLDFKVKGEFKSPSQFKTLYESRTYFLTRLLETQLKLIDKQIQGNMSFMLIHIFFLFQYQHNIYQAVLAIVKSSKGAKRSYMEQLRFSVTEYYLLEKILQEFKSQDAKENMNYATFIESNQMQQNLDWLFEETTIDVLQFWKIFQQEQANVREAYVLGMQISKNISQIKDYTTKLEEQQLIKDYNKYYYYAMFYQNILNDKQSYNQMLNNLRNLLMVRNMRKKSSRFSGLSDINDVGFAIVSFEDDKTLGRFKYANRVICQMLSTSEDSILEKSVKYLMPELISQNHQFFIKRFLAEGLPRFLGRVRTVFVKDFNNYIRPSQFYINFHYNSKFQYSLVLHIDPILTVNFLNNQIVPMKHVFIILADPQNNIKDISINCKSIIGLSQKQLKTQEEILGRSLRMEDIVFQMGSFEQYVLENPNALITNQVVKVRTFRNVEQNYVTCSMQYEEITYLQNNEHQFSEKVYLFIPVSKLPEYDHTSMSDNLNYNSTAFISHNVGSREGESYENAMQFWASSDFTGSENQGDKFMSGSASVSSQSSSGTGSSLSYTKGLLFQERSPKVLRLYLYIVFCVLICFIAVSSINFIMFMQKKGQVDLQIQFNSLINQRNSQLATCLASLKQLQLIVSQNISNAGLNSLNKSNIFDPIDRFSYYSVKLNESSSLLLNLHEDFRSLSHRNPSISYDPSSELYNDVELYYLSKKYQIFQNSDSFDFGLSLLVSNIGVLTAASLIKERIPANINQVIAEAQKKNDPYLTASDSLRSLFYIFMNGMTSLNFLGTNQEEDIQRIALDASQENKLFINLMSFISIGVISIVGVVTFPILGKIEDRKISVLKFFNLLSAEQINIQIDRCKEFQSEFISLSRDTNQKDGEAENLEEEYDDETESDEDYEGSHQTQPHRVNFAVHVEDVELDYQDERIARNNNQPPRMIKSALKDASLLQTGKRRSSNFFQKLNEEEMKINSSQMNSVSSKTEGANSLEESGENSNAKINQQVSAIGEKGLITFQGEQNKRLSDLNPDLEDVDYFKPGIKTQNYAPMGRGQRSQFDTLDPGSNPVHLQNVVVSSKQNVGLAQQSQSRDFNDQAMISSSELKNNDRQRVKFAPEQHLVQRKSARFSHKGDNQNDGDQIGGFQPKKRGSMKKRRQSKTNPQNRKNSDAIFTSAFDIQRIFEKINQNEEKQTAIRNNRKRERKQQAGVWDEQDEQKHNKRAPKKQLHQLEPIEEQNEASQKIQAHSSNKNTSSLNVNTRHIRGINSGKGEFDDIRRRSKLNKLHGVFEVNKDANPSKQKRNIFQRDEEEMKHAGRKNTLGLKNEKRKSKGSLNSSVKMNPLGKTNNEDKGMAGIFKGHSAQTAKMHNERHQNHDKEDAISRSESFESSEANSQSENEAKKSYKDIFTIKIATSRTDSIQDALERIALKEKLKLALYVLIVIVFLNSNLITSFYIGQKTFDEAQTSISSLAVYYHKENYLGNLLFYTMEEFIENRTISYNNVNMASQFLDQTNQNQNQYKLIRKSYPYFLTSVQSSLEALESKDMCGTVFASNSSKLQNCLTTYNGLFQNGLTSSVYSILNYMQTLQVNFQTSNRTNSFLREVITDLRFRDQFDLFNEFIHDILAYMSSQATSSAKEYFNSLYQSYMTIYTVYICLAVLLCFFFGLFVFKKLKQQILTSVNIMAIIPLEELDNRDRLKIEAFLNQ